MKPDRCKTPVRAFLSRQSRGAGVIEYGILAALISIVAIASIGELGRKITETFAETSVAFTEAMYTENPGPAASSPPVEAVDVDPMFIGAGAFMRTPAVTSLDFPIHADTLPGDLMVATVMHRGSALTASEGWIREASIADPGNYWTTSILTKPYVSGDGTIATFAHSATNWLQRQIYTLRGDGIGVRSVEDQTGQEQEHAGAPFVTGEEGTFLISVMHEAYAYTDLASE